jgi:hypothetical protein
MVEDGDGTSATGRSINTVDFCHPITGGRVMSIDQL